MMAAGSERVFPSTEMPRIFSTSCGLEGWAKVRGAGTSRNPATSTSTGTVRMLRSRCALGEPVVQGSAILRLGQLFADHAKAAFAALIVADRGVQLVAAERRPEFLADENVRVGKVPEEEIADAELAARADQQIRIGNAGGGKVRGHKAVVDRCRVKSLCEGVLDDPFHGARDFPPAAVTQGEDQCQARIVPCLLNIV